MKIIKWFLIFNIYLIFSLLISSSAFSNNLRIPSEIQFKLNNSQYNNYLRKSMRAYTDGELYGKKNIKKKYKKWIKAKILVDGKKINAKIRILGDWKDHLRLPETSLKVKIIDESYYGITRFNLFLPETRKGENEVFWTLMLKKLGFPALHTRMVEVNLNGNIYKAIFQEDATKEFLERNNLTETVILKKNDFDFYLKDSEKEIYSNFFSSSFVIDNNNFLKNETANFIASEAIALKSNLNFKNQVANNNFFKSIHQKHASHALADINRKYIYLPYKKVFLPLYYDGNVQFLPGKTDCKNVIENKIILDFKKNYKDLTNKNLSKLQECVFKDIYNLSLDNKKELENFFLSSKFKKGKTKKYSEIKTKIINYFKNETVSKKINISKFSEKIIIYTFIYNDKFFKCYLSVKNKNLISCNELDGKNYSKLISESGRYQLSNNFKSFPINLGTLNKEIQIIKLVDNAKEFYIDKNATYHYVVENKNNQNLKFIFKNNKSRLFIQGNFKDVNFDFKKEFNTTEIKKENTRYDKNLLTGCVNFYNTNFNNVSLKSLHMDCEDSINIKNSKGVIDNIEINNSLYDGLDIDFSKLKIKNIVVNNAQNDCLDFSFGEYDITQVSLSNCADKGASVGERSKLNLNEGYITKSNIGVASKDNASTDINKIKIEKVDTCLAAYNKKREFKGSTINVNYFSCNSFNTKKKFDDQSEILISNEY
tara:strand:+ start:1167 stop:3296 length:2130 start_codon:yes stop_codon:yes gene_type:complete